MRATIPIGIQPGTKLLRIDRVIAEKEEWPSYWKIWLHHDLQMQHGTYLALYDDGCIERITIGRDGTETTERIK